MEQIEKLLGKKIIRIETNDLDDMEEVCCCLFLISGVTNWQAENEKGVEVITWLYRNLITGVHLICIVHAFANRALAQINSG